MEDQGPVYRFNEFGVLVPVELREIANFCERVTQHDKEAKDGETTITTGK